MRPPRRTILAAVGVLLAGGITTGTAPASAAPPVNSGTAAGTDCVKDIPVTSTDSITPDGEEVPLTPGLATMYHYDSPGTNSWEVVPPAGWTPLTATDQELKTYVFPPRPVASDTQAVAKWRAGMSTWRRTTAAPSMCETSLRSGLKGPSTSLAPNIVGTGTSLSWAGGEAIDLTGSIWTTDNRWTQPAFTSNTCGVSTAAYSVWGGIGGDHTFTQSLLQAGEITGSDLVSWPFWTALASGHSMYVSRWKDVTTYGGDDVESWVYYTGGTAYMAVINHTRGWSRNKAFTSLNGLAASGYYNGNSAELITEAPLSGKVPVPLLRPAAAGQTLLYSMTVNGSPIASYGSQRITQVEATLIDDSNFDGQHAWYNTQNHCTD